ncbi:hypothetical protein GmHk_18G051856 [Glycine max]|nr:hypothetical protein GmHk_18G051856 [Glycine max]
MIVILPKENLVVWFCSLHNKPDNYLKGIINRWIVVKYFNDVRPLEAERLKVLRIQWAQYYLKVRIKHRMLGNYYFNDVRPLEAERLKALRIQWAQYYLKVRIKLMMLGKYVILGYLISLLACFTFFTIAISF